MSESDRPSPPTVRELLANPSIAALLLSSCLSAAVAVGLAVAVGKLVYDISERALDLGYVGLAEFVPTALLVFVAGMLADRFDRRKITALGYLAEAAVIVGLVFYALSEPTSTWPAFVLIFLFGASRGFVNPAARALRTSIAPPEVLPRLMPLFSVTWQSATIVGPILAGLLYAIDPAYPFLAFTVMIVVSAASMKYVTLYNAPKPLTDRPTFGAALEGLRFMRRTPLVFAVITLDLVAVLLGGAVALAPALAEERLGVDSVGLGMLRAAGGVGAAITAVLLIRKPIERNVGRRLLYAVGLFGLATIGLGLTRNFVVALVVLAAIAAADMVSVFIRSTIVPLATPDSMRGRVLAVEAVFIGASNELGAFESGLTAELFGLVNAIIIGGVATVIVAVLWWFVFPSMRKVDRFSEITHPDNL